MESDNNLTENYTRATEWLFAQLPMFSRIGAAAYKPGLDTAHRLDSAFGHPHRSFRSVHVAGTNGKGSTSHMLAAILQASGYRVGLYTSPHLVDFRERIRVNGDMIPRHDVVDFVERWRATPYEGHPSFFELTMMMAFDHFARSGVDYAVIEVGMGGRLDSTNIITPLTEVITNISKDHTQFLGATTADIAREKAGIIKPGIPLVIGRAAGEVRDVFAEAAHRAGVEPRWASETPMAHGFTPLAEGGWEFATERYGILRSPLGGDYQRENIETVLHAVEAIREAGTVIPDDAVRTGIAGVVELTGLAGRWMHVSENPLVIADTGHNIDGLGHNMAQLERLRVRTDATAGEGDGRRRLRFVIGFVADKAIDEIIELLPRDAEYYVTQASVPRALPADELSARFEAAGLRHRTVVPAPEAYRQALAECTGDDMLYVGGSTFVVADVLAAIRP